MLITMDSFEVMSLVMNLRSSIAFWFLVVRLTPVCGLPCPFNATTGTIDLSSQNLTSLTNLTFITVYNCSGLFGNTSSMDLSHNSIMSMDADTFSKWYEITALNLSHNRLADIEHSTFLSLLNLQSLDLSHNSLTQLKAGVIDLISLQTVTFENNSIIYVEPGIVNQIHENLIYFNLNYNLLTSLDVWPFLVHNGGGQQDKVFDIQHNNISDITNTIGWTYHRIYSYELIVNIQHNNIKTLGRYIFDRLGINITDGLVETFLLHIVGLNVTHNPFLCDCRLYDFSISLRDSIFRWSRIDEFRLRCSEPSSVAGVDWLHDLPLDSFICNVTSECPSVCSCQDRPHNDTFHIDCSNAGLTHFPDLSNLSLNGRSKLELNLDYNYLKIIPHIFHIDKLYNISMRYNNIEKISTEFIKNATILNRLDLRDNKIRALPREIQRYNYRTVFLSGNPLWCDCDTLWLAEWASTGDNSLHCDSAEGMHALVYLTEDLLACIDRRASTVFIVVGVIVSIGIVILIVIVKCPYDAKVILYSIFRTHPWEQYKIDEDAEKMVDIYLIFDENDHDVVGFVDTILTQRIKKLKPIYNIVNPERVYLEADELIRKSKRVLIVLSEKLFVNENKLEEIKQADRNVFEAIANQRAYQESVVEDEEWIKNAARIIYIKYNNSRQLTTSLNEISLRSWLTCSKYQRFLDTSHRLFWRQLRYELPPTGCGVTRGKFSQSMSRRGANTTVTNEHNKCSPENKRNSSSSNRGTHNQEVAGYTAFDQLCDPSGSSVISRTGIDSRQSERLSVIECDSVNRELSSQSLRVINEVLKPESHEGGTVVTNKRVHAVSRAQLLLHVKACSDLNV